MVDRVKFDWDVVKADLEKAMILLTERPSFSGGEVVFLREDSKRLYHLSLRTQGGYDKKFLETVSSDFPKYYIDNHGHDSESLRWIWINLREYETH